MLIVSLSGVTAFFDGSQWQSESDELEDELNFTLLREPIDVAQSLRDGGIYHTALKRAKILPGLKVIKFRPPKSEEVEIEGVDA